MELALWTDDADLAAVAAAAGVDWIGPDLETAGKLARQAGTDTRRSRHRADCLAAIRAAAGAERLFVRSDPADVVHGAGLERLLAEGVRLVMLPMARCIADVQAITRQIDGRAALVVTIEHVDALDAVDAIAKLPGVAALYLGANDLSLSLGLASRFGVFARPIADRVAEAARRHGLRFGFRGLARAGDASLPVPGDLVMAEWARLGADFAIVARSFRADPSSLAAEIAAARARIAWWARADAAACEEAHAAFVAACRAADAAARARGPSGSHPAARTG
jgi:2-keto-3-deoxy-L-rhamnonate aldolase RhmA